MDKKTSNDFLEHFINDFNKRFSNHPAGSLIDFAKDELSRLQKQVKKERQFSKVLGHASLNEYFYSLGYEHRKQGREIDLQTTAERFINADTRNEGHYSVPQLIESALFGMAVYEFETYLQGIIKGEIEQELINTPPPETFEKTGLDTHREFIAWLQRLGVIDAVLNHCKIGETYNWRMAGRLISTFTNINSDTARKIIAAIHGNGITDKNPNPFEDPETKLKVQDLAKKYKLKPTK